MPRRRIYAAGREPYFNLNSTWYDPAGSWLDNRRKPFRYVVNTACASCDKRCDVPRRGGHNYRCYGYRNSSCRSEYNPRLVCGFRNPSGGPRDYWGRPIGDSCDGNTGGVYTNEESVDGSCCGGSGGCGAGGGSMACAQPSASVGGCGGIGVCSEPGCRSSRGLQTSGASVCAEPCGSTSGGCGGGRRGVCSEPGCRSSRRRRSVCSETCSRSSGGCQPYGRGVCAEPWGSYSGGCGRGGRGVCAEP
ncbi:keratin-associated protein 5-1-like [Sceloporus undulatus]|uniref:keratin-associated protein 5-1-like n=1 Tax=Sceloporus undulatus TaxID=8520 RepID=UPI001C4B091E|nr:keratin-associated protein 5-1-like [Sceloporus undulatus]